MSRATVRADVAAFLAPPAVAHLDIVYAQAPAPFLNSAANFNFPVDQDNLGWCIVAIERDVERRITTCDDSGDKEMRYTVRLQVVYRSRSEAEKAQDEFDDLMDSLRARLRSDRRLGSTVIFEAGEAGEGDYGIQGEYLEPQLLPTTRLVTCGGAVRFEVVELVSG